MTKSSLDKLGSRLAEFSSQEERDAKRLEAAERKLEEERKKSLASRKQRSREHREIWSFLEEGGAELMSSAFGTLKQNEASVLFVRDLLEALMKDQREKEVLRALCDLAEMQVPENLWKKSRAKKPGAAALVPEMPELSASALGSVSENSESLGAQE